MLHALEDQLTNRCRLAKPSCIRESSCARKYGMPRHRPLGSIRVTVFPGDRIDPIAEKRSIHGWLFLWQNSGVFRKRCWEDQLQLQCWKVDLNDSDCYNDSEIFWLRPLDFVPKFCPQLEVPKFVVSICKGPSNLRLKCLHLVLPQSTPQRGEDWWLNSH